MTGLPTACGRLWALLRRELRQLLQFNRSDRRWQLPFCAALASGLPLMVGLYFDHIEYGLVSSLGGLIFLYTPATPLAHRMMVLMSCSFGMIACHALGPPRGVFFMMAASIGAFSPVELLELPLRVGLFTLGCLLACLIAFFYSLHVLSLQAPQPVVHHFARNLAVHGGCRCAGTSGILEAEALGITDLLDQFQRVFELSIGLSGEPNDEIS